MALWKDTNNGIHDDMNGEAVTLLPVGCVPITQGEVDALLAPPAPTLGQAQSTQIALINASADAAFSSITASYPKQEVDTWPNQYTEATAFTANPASATPTLSAIATATGSTVSAIAALVLQKAAAYTAASGAVVGRRKLLTAQVQAATTVSQVQGVIW